MSQPFDSFDLHSPAWVLQTWVSFVAAIGTTATGIAYLPVDRWIQAFEVRPGNRAVVHHVIAFLAEPAQAAEIEARDAADPGPGYSCYGNAGTNKARWVGACKTMRGNWPPVAYVCGVSLGQVRTDSRCVTTGMFLAWL